MRVAIRLASRQFLAAKSFFARALCPQFSRAIIPSVLPSATHRNGASLDAHHAAPPPSLDALDVAALASLTPLQLAALAQRLAALLASISIAQFQHASAQAAAKDAMPTRMIDADTAAAILHKPRRWLFDHAKRMPWIKRLSRKAILIDEAGMHRWLASRH